MEKIFLIFPKTHVNLSPELGVCTILNSFIYNYFSSISSNFFESKILITSAGLKKNQSNSDFLLAVGKMNRFCIPIAKIRRLILSQKCKNGNVSAPVGAISLEIACAARSVGVGQVRRLRRLAMTLFRLLSLSLSFSIPSLWSLGSFEIVAASFTTAFPPRRQTSRAHSFTLSCPDVTSY